MSHTFINKTSRSRLKRAVETVESRSAAEVMVVVRPWSGRCWHVDLAAGSLAAFVFLLAALFTDINFSPVAVVCNVLIAFGIGAMIMTAAAPVRLFFATRQFVELQVKRLGQSLFYQLGVDRTRDRSGILVFVSLLEKRCRVVPDVGVTQSMSEEAWQALSGALETSVSTYGVGAAGVDKLAEAIEALTEPLETALPRRHDDINELPDIMDEDEAKRF